MKTVNWLIQALFYVGAGVNHFVRPGMYLKIMPPYLPAPELLNYASGAAEVLLGALLFFPGTRVWASWGLIALLLAVFPANIYMWQKGGAAFGLPDWLLIARLPLQVLLMFWAYSIQL